MKCWGHNGYGQLGDGTNAGPDCPPGACRSNPVAVCASGFGAGCSGGAALDGVVAIAAGGYHTCALTSPNEIKCWGDNFYGQLGDGTNAGPDCSPAVCRLNPVAVCASGSGAGCSGGAVLDGVVAIAAGNGHTCALNSSGGAKCWGGNFYGRLGDGTTTHRWNPVNVCTTGSNCQGPDIFHDAAYRACGELQVTVP